MSTGKFGKPDSPVVSRSECAATLTLIQLLLQQLVERGDLPDALIERLDDFAGYINGLNLRVSKRHDQWVEALVVSAVLPSFHRIYDDDQEEAWTKLEQLMQKRAA